MTFVWCHVIVFWTVLGGLGKLSIFRSYGIGISGVVLVRMCMRKYISVCTNLFLVTSLDVVRLGSQSNYRVILILPYYSNSYHKGKIAAFEFHMNFR